MKSELWGTTDPFATDAFGALGAACAAPLRAARSAADSGRRAIGYVGNTVPVEIIEAADCFAVRVVGGAFENTGANEWVEDFSDPEVRRIFASFLSGELDFLARLIIPRSSDSYHKLFLAMREAQDRGRVKPALEIELLDLPHTQSELVASYGLARIQAFASSINGGDLSEERLSEAIEASNRSRALIAQARALRESTPSLMAGSIAQVIGAARGFLSSAQFNAALGDALRDYKPTPQEGVRVFVKGVPQDTPWFYSLLENHGGVVAAEDDEWGSRAGGAPIPAEANPLHAVFEHYYAHVACPRIHPREARERWFLNAVSTIAVDGVVLHVPRPDDVIGWDVPFYRDELDKRGLPCVVIRDDTQAAQADIDAFFTRLRRRAS